MSEPWTRQEQINYAVFHSKEAPPEWRNTIDSIISLARVTGHVPGTSIFDHFNKLLDVYNNASMSVD